MPSRTRLLIAAAAVVCVPAIGLRVTAKLRAVYCEPTTRVVVADGRSHRVGRLWRTLGVPPSPDDLSASGAKGGRVSFGREADGSTDILYRAPVRGGAIVLRVKSTTDSWLLPMQAAQTLRDHVGDGLPDALRLHNADDRVRFRKWFTALADGAAAVPDVALPSEITDCSALLRYSYRIALMRHDDRWYKQFPPGTMPVLPDVEQWNYPDTPLGAGLFRVRPVHGPVPLPADFAEFADAKTLLRLNSFRVGRDARAAKAGDLLFFRQEGTEEQYHSMIVTGEGAEWVVYHTGPGGSGALLQRGEMRRARIEELLQHPDPRWRPTLGNTNFLGVFRWNLLRED